MKGFTEVIRKIVYGTMNLVLLKNSPSRNMLDSAKATMIISMTLTA